MPGLFINARDLQLIEGYTTYDGAWRRLDSIKDTLGKGKAQKITIPEYCKLVDINIEIVCKALKLQKTLQLSLL